MSRVPLRSFFKDIELFVFEGCVFLSQLFLLQFCDSFCIPLSPIIPQLPLLNTDRQLVFITTSDTQFRPIVGAEHILCSVRKVI